MVNIQFDKQDYNNTFSHAEFKSSSGIVNFLIKEGIFKDAKQGQALLIKCSIIIFLGVFVYFIYSLKTSSGTIDTRIRYAPAVFLEIKSLLT